MVFLYYVRQRMQQSLNRNGATFVVADIAFSGWLSAMKANDNDMSEPQRIKALETIISKLQKDLARVEVMHKLTPTNSRLKKQKGAVEKALFLALAELSKLRKKAVR